jgi:flavin-dependent dehydrogenase
VLDVTQNADSARVSTDATMFEAQVIVGADGSGSRVRRAVFDARKETIGRALMTDVAVDPERTPEFTSKRYRFDFRCVSRGISGYSWSFPCLIAGAPHLNVGIYDQRAREFEENGGAQSRMIAELIAAFPELPLDGLKRRETRWHSFPIRWFNPADSYVSGRVILAGDAAGVDPLMGEGISCAFEHGKLAAAAICKYLDGDSAALRGYNRALHQDWIGRKMSKLAFAARNFYGPRHRFFFRIANVSRRAQELGVDWYNGAGHLDELPTHRLVARWARAVLLGESLR